MREIKFRAWDKEHKVLRDVTRIDFLKGTVSLCEDTGYFNYTCNMDEVILMQYTGLKDKNGKEIYEGDIFKKTVHLTLLGTDLDEMVDEYIVVRYIENYAGFYVGELPLSSYVNSTTDFYTSCPCSLPVVTGNMYENPELLEG